MRIANDVPICCSTVFLLCCEFPDVCRALTCATNAQKRSSRSAMYYVKIPNNSSTVLLLFNFQFLLYMEILKKM
ncbi:hypothetical protein CIT292_08448 [Citrobacter youngae ATCC 29220]|uniref:Uncharacterized protein n=1 Tax=Citrobacter youngae ATCC 29220 TaxID=500640 RepID=D4BD82_9ENTR|nr:hypothetical protein CIT292_08448 [Citrobacter youngae ATCC 29220]